MKRAYVDVIGCLDEGTRCLLKLKNGVYVSGVKNNIWFTDEIKGENIPFHEIHKFKLIR